MTEIVVLQDHEKGSATHALIIGVGEYRHLQGGPGPLDPRWSIGQLAGAATSARAFLDWMRDSFHNPAAPLGTIQHLITGPEGAALGSAEPTLLAVTEAFDLWVERAKSHPDNIALFYFAGHGVSKGAATGLLLADFSPPGAAALMRNAIDLEATVTGMFSCKADRQLFLIDACRTTEQPLLDAMTGPGQVLASANASDIRQIPQPVLYATGLTRHAFMQVGKASPFTRALIRSLDGMGAVDRSGGYEPGQCEVDTNSLSLGARAALQFDVAARYLDGQQVTPGNAGSFVFHYPRTQIKIPLRVGCAPLADNQNATLSIKRDGADFFVRKAPAADDLVIEVPPDKYRSTAVLNPSGETRSKGGLIVPPYGEHRLAPATPIATGP